MSIKRAQRRVSKLLGFLSTVVAAWALSGCETESRTSSELQPVNPPQVSASSDDDTSANPPDETESTVSESGTPEVTKNSDSEESSTAESNSAEPPAAGKEEQTIEIPASWKRLGKHEIWIDFKQKQIIVAGIICLNAGPLEMFACPANTKEHESVISANALSSEVHSALIALGAEPGSPCQWDPEYKPATGPVIDIQVAWFDDEKQKPVKIAAPMMIRNSRTRKPMTHQWVFGGSQIWEDPATGDKIYYGDAGEMVCLSNFSTATMDLNVESSQSNDGLLFEAFTENIPPIGTKVYMHLKPGARIEAAAKAEPKNENPDIDSSEESSDDQEIPQN